MKKKPASVDKYNRNNGHMCNLMSDDKTTAIVKVNTEYVKYKSNTGISIQKVIAELKETKEISMQN